MAHYAQQCNLNKGGPVLRPGSESRTRLSSDRIWNMHQKQRDIQGCPALDCGWLRKKPVEEVLCNRPSESQTLRSQHLWISPPPPALQPGAKPLGLKPSEPFRSRVAFFLLFGSTMMSLQASTSDVSVSASSGYFPSFQPSGQLVLKAQPRRRSHLLRVRRDINATRGLSPLTSLAPSYQPFRPTLPDKAANSA